MAHRAALIYVSIAPSLHCQTTDTIVRCVCLLAIVSSQYHIKYCAIKKLLITLIVTLLQKYC